MESRLAIRRGVPADHERLVELWLRSVRATHTFLTEEQIQELLPLVREQALPALEIWVLTREDELVGFSGLDGNKLEALFLDPSFHRQGGGKLLVDHARKLKGPLTVDVNEQHPEAQKFYEAMGFELIGRSDFDSAGRPYPLLHMRDRQDEITTSQIESNVDVI